jgi:site-specific DNA-methyltransferase (adenine-specific)
VAVNKGKWDVSAGIDADHAFHRSWLEPVHQCLSPTGSLFVTGTHHAIYSIGFALQQLGLSIVSLITWYKPNAAPNLACRTFAHSTELLIWAAPPTAQETLLRRYSTHLQQGAFDFEVPEPYGKQVIWGVTTPGPREKQFGRHPTQKPLTLLQRIIALASDPGDFVLDPFAGSGTTGVAAVQLNRRFIGFELDPAYIQLSKSRLKSLPMVVA